jgi:hypothetical protein
MIFGVIMHPRWRWGIENVSISACGSDLGFFHE